MYRRQDEQYIGGYGEREEEEEEEEEMPQHMVEHGGGTGYDGLSDYRTYPRYEDLQMFNPFFMPVKKDKDCFDSQTIACYGRRGTGKSYAMRDLCYHYQRYFELVIVFTATKLNKFWSPIVGDKYVYEPQFIIPVGQKVLDMQKEREKRKKELVRVLMIFDDVVANTSFRWNQFVLEMACNGRHHNVACIISTQYPKLLSTSNRANADVILCWSNVTKTAREAIFDCCMPLLYDNGEKQHLLDEYTMSRPHQSFAVLYFRFSNKFTDFYMQTEFQEPPPFFMGNWKQAMSNNACLKRSLTMADYEHMRSLAPICDFNQLRKMGFTRG